MKIKRVLLILLAALGLSLAGMGVAEPAIAGGRGGIFGDCTVGCEQASMPEAVIAGGKGGIFGDCAVGCEVAFAPEIPSQAA